MNYQDSELTGLIIAGAIEVHKALGPGLLESVYKHCMVLELEERGLKCRQEVLAPLVYKNRRVDSNFRVDLLVEEKIVVELKSVDLLHSLHEAQIITYLRLLEKQVGLLINFNVKKLKTGIRRCVLGAKDTTAQVLT